MRWLVAFVVLGVACDRDDRLDAVAAALRARGPVPISTSPDGDRVLVELPRDRGPRLEVVARRTGRLIARRDDDEPMIAPVWRGDGGAIAYFRARGHRRAYDLRIWTLAGGDRALGVPVTATAWFASDGARLAYLASDGGDRALGVPVTATALFASNGVRLAYLASDGGDRALGVPATATAFARFSPDGARLAYLASDEHQTRVLTVAGIAAPGVRALAGVADRAELAWSPDGRWLATATAASPGALTVLDAAGDGALEIPVVDGELRDLAWSPDGRVVAVTGRADRDEHLRVFRVRIADRTVEPIAPAAGDAHAPRFVGDELAYHVEREGERRIYIAGPTGVRAIGGDGSARLTGVAGDTAIAIVRSRTSPARLAAFPLRGASESPPEPTRGPPARRIDVVARDGAIESPPAPTRGPPARRIDVVARDGLRVPAYLWRAPAAVGAVVIVHGGPALHAVPAWSEKVQLLVDAGLDVVKLDYRGSTGHGAAFEARGADLAGGAADVLAARDHLARTERLPPERIVLVGESHGAGLVAAAAAADEVASPVVLVATAPLPADPPRAARCAAFAFHGADDDLAPPDEARAHLARLFGRELRWRLIPGEGHNLAQLRSWAAIYAQIIDLVEHRCGA